jgi:hypothetical protein
MNDVAVLVGTVPDDHGKTLGEREFMKRLELLDV